ncbi:hypothetical protein [Bradyrhizobium sp. G127]|uniref:hypothetical protein n=1 Tax=Bradyrhizobium sp. G127 TaxID=2904800 RepID=UPI001F471EFE|nr:hypothetical protein [Bradyrhizobium sp. G127]MCF2521719.1 hypothetical protein [Bradyrhizobium sp. G127]
MREQSRRLASRYWITSKKHFGFVVVLLAVVILTWSPAKAAESGDTKSAGGLTVYLGVVPAEIIEGPGPHLAERPMHGGAPKGQHEHHVVVAVYDSASNIRITDATVTAKISGIGLSDPQKILEPMTIANTITYGAYYNVSADLYTISVTVQRPGSQAVVLDFKYDHRQP